MNDLICSACDNPCSIVEIEVDYAFFPYHHRALRSSCCHEVIKHSDGSIYWWSELKEPYIKQQSMEISSNDL